MEHGIAIHHETFEVWNKLTGEKFLADDRTFDPEVHSKEPVEVEAAS